MAQSAKKSWEEGAIVGACHVLSGDANTDKNTNTAWSEQGSASKEVVGSEKYPPSSLFRCRGSRVIQSDYPNTDASLAPCKI